MGAKFIVLVVIVVLTLVFIIQNQAPCQISFFWLHKEGIPTIVVLLVTFILGLIVGWILAALGRRQGRDGKTTKESDPAGK